MFGKGIVFLFVLLLTACQTVPSGTNVVSAESQMKSFSTASQSADEHEEEIEEEIFYLPDNPMGIRADVENSRELFPSPVESSFDPIPEVQLLNGVPKAYRLIFPAEEGAEVRAVSSGTVMMVQNKLPPEMSEEEFQAAMLGKFAIVWLGDGLSIRYAHLSEVTVEVGQTVEPGETIGIVGDSGVALLQSHQPICGIYVMENGLQINPLPYFEMQQEYEIVVR